MVSPSASNPVRRLAHDQWLPWRTLSRFRTGQWNDLGTKYGFWWVYEGLNQQQPLIHHLSFWGSPWGFAEIPMTSYDHIFWLWTSWNGFPSHVQVLMLTVRQGLFDLNSHQKIWDYLSMGPKPGSLQFTHSPRFADPSKSQRLAIQMAGKPHEKSPPTWMIWSRNHQHLLGNHVETA